MSSFCIFQEPWWLDAVAPGRWKSLEVLRGSELVARMPIVIQRKFGLTLIRQPPLTPMLGPWIRVGGSSAARRLSEERRYYDDLIDQLPRWDYFEASFNHRLTNWLPFYWRNFKQTTRYTYILDDVSDLELLLRRVEGAVRTDIRKAQKQVSIRTDLPLDTLLDLVELTFRRQGRALPFPRELVRRIDKACLARDARRLLFAQDEKGRTHAALYLIKDAEYVYYLLGGADPALRGSGAHSLLIWEAIRIASELGLKFDFEGSMIEPVERAFRAFGPAQVPYLHVYGATPLVAVLLLTRELALRSRRRLSSLGSTDRKALPP